MRVMEGGHNIKEGVIERRYKGGIKNLFELYLPIVDGAMIFDNSNGRPELIANKTAPFEMEVLNLEKFNLLKNGI